MAHCCQRANLFWIQWHIWMQQARLQVLPRMLPLWVSRAFCSIPPFVMNCSRSLPHSAGRHGKITSTKLDFLRSSRMSRLASVMVSVSATTNPLSLPTCLRTIPQLVITPILFALTSRRRLLPAGTPPVLIPMILLLVSTIALPLLVSLIKTTNFVLYQISHSLATTLYNTP